MNYLEIPMILIIISLAYILNPNGIAMYTYIAFQHIFIDQLELPPRVYNCLRRANIHTLSDLLNYSREDLMRIECFGKESVEQVFEILQKCFAIDPPRN
jgi:DNA-directed RNA polymerase subunit alpha